MKRKFEGILGKEKNHSEDLVTEFMTVCTKHLKESSEDYNESQKTSDDINKR